MPASGDLPCVISATPCDIDTVAELAVHVTREHPIVDWLFPKAVRRTPLLHAWWTLTAEHALDHGHVDLLADHSAAAIWLDRTQPQPPRYQRRPAATFSPIIDAAGLLAQAFARHRPPMPHLYLAVLAVAPTRRRQGRARTLLGHRHRHLDRNGTHAYLKAGTADQLALHSALGYQVGESFYLPVGPAIWPMLRAPQSGNRASAEPAGRPSATCRYEPFWPPDIN